MKTRLLTLLIAACALFTGTLTNAQVRQTKLYIDDGSSAFTVLTTGAMPGGGTLQLPSETGVRVDLSTFGSYHSAPSVTFPTPPAGATPPTAVAYLNATLTSITLGGGGGSGYSSAPNVEITSGGGAGAAATANFSASVSSLTLVSGGSGYDPTPGNEPAVTIGAPGGGGTTATATATVHGVVTSFSFTGTPVGFTTGDEVDVDGGFGGSGGTGTIVDDGFGGIDHITVTTPGSGYTASSGTTTHTGGGTGAVITAHFSGPITVSLTDGGSGYTTVPSVVIDPPTSGATAHVTASILGSVTGFTITSGGSHYTSNPTVTLTGGGGTGASGTAVITGPVAGVRLTTPGSGYAASAGTVTFSAGISGSTATGSVVIPTFFEPSFGGAASGGAQIWNAGDLPIATGAGNYLDRLGIGTDGQVLTVHGGLPTWLDPTASTITSTTVNASTNITIGGSGSPASGVVLFIQDGHIQTHQTTAPTWGVHGEIGTYTDGDFVSSLVQTGSTDVAGKIDWEIDNGSVSPDVYITVRYTQAYTNPVVVFSPTTQITAGNLGSIWIVSNPDSFEIHSVGSNLFGRAFGISYQVIEAN